MSLLNNQYAIQAVHDVLTDTVYASLKYYFEISFFYLISTPPKGVAASENSDLSRRIFPDIVEIIQF